MAKKIEDSRKIVFGAKKGGRKNQVVLQRV